MKKFVSLPISFSKWRESSLIKPELYLKHLNRSKHRLPSPFPKRVIICFHPYIAWKMKKAPNIGFKKKLPFISHSLCSLDLYQKNRNRTLVVSNIGIGAPSVSFCIEELQYLGVKEFISVGTVGALDTSKLKVGTKVFLTKALRQEACSFHYLRPSLFVEADKKGSLFKKIAKLKLRRVNTWTTDAFYRESEKELIDFKKKNIHCVEMEVASLMAVAKYYNLFAYCLAVVSDGFNGTSWRFKLSNKKVKQNLMDLLKSVLYL